jgi:hypothetical protein
MSRHLTGTVALCAVLLASSRVAVAGGDMLSHRAAYRLSLGKTDSGAGLESVRGALVVEWRADCSGWLSQQRLGFVARTNEGPGFTYDVRFSSWEAPDYTRLRFQTRSFDDGKPGDAFVGAAALDARGGKGEARYTEPKDEQIELPPGTLFPTEHVLRLIEAANAGEQIVEHYVFDGSGPDALNKVTAVIGRPQPGGEGEEQHWPVRLAYYDITKADALPQFQLSFALSPRGVLNNLVLDYGDFALKGELEKLETLPVPACP